MEVLGQGVRKPQCLGKSLPCQAWTVVPPWGCEASLRWGCCTGRAWSPWSNGPTGKLQRTPSPPAWTETRKGSWSQGVFIGESELGGGHVAARPGPPRQRFPRHWGGLHWLVPSHSRALAPHRTWHSGRQARRPSEKPGQLLLRNWEDFCR